MPHRLVNRQGPEGFIPSGGPQVMSPSEKLASMRAALGMLSPGDLLRALLASLTTRQAQPEGVSTPPVRPETLRGINGMLRPRSAPRNDNSFPPRNFPPRG